MDPLALYTSSVTKWDLSKILGTSYVVIVIYTIIHLL